MGISSVVSRSLRVAYLFAIVLIIAIHYNSRIATPDAPVDQGNHLVQEFITNGIARVAVPLYAFSAGFFFFLSYRDVFPYLKNLKKRTRTLLVPYLVVSAAMSIALLILRVLVKRNCDLHLLDLLGEILFHPRAAQLWFLRDLLLLVIIAPGIRFLAKALRGTFVLVLFGFWLFDLQ